MNEYQRRLMGKPSIEREDGLCPFCLRPAETRHHIVPRSQGGAKGPTVAVCGYDNVTGCHGKLHHHRIHLDWDDESGWVYISTECCKLEEARQREGWRKVSA